MQREFGRTDRLGDAIQRELAVLIRDEMRDPRVGMVTITGVDVSRDLAHARVYVTAVDLQEGDHAELVGVLNGASGFLRTVLARELDVRVTPKLKFFYDESGQQGRQLSALIDQAIRTDKKRRETSGDGSN
ncbi:MAG: 30S ribosome-binding factor RbfA [bacterium]